MTINAELFKAILAMDAYNRSYGEGIKLTGTQIGTATILDDSESFGKTTNILGQEVRIDENVGFYAVAYELGGQKIISYRGTDANLVSPWGDVGSDLLRGYATGGGSPNNSQADLAIAFYKAVAGNGVDPRTANISLTGHSLGGGLAGYVGSLYGKSGTLFDNMAFENASSTAAFAAANPTLYAANDNFSIADMDNAA